MMYASAPFRIAVALAVLCFCLPVAQAAVHPDWRPITHEELALKQSKIDASADAEALFREVWIDQHATTNYLRFKIYNDRGREKYADVRIEYWGGFSVSDISGRTIHPDGTVIDLNKDSIFDQMEVKSKKGNLKVKALSFALPAVEAGSIIEYRWTENNRLAKDEFIPLDIQSEYPVDEVTFHLKPAGTQANLTGMRLMSFGCQPEKSGSDSKGFTAVTVRDVPAFHDEPYSPPERACRKWILVSYEGDREAFTSDFWSSLGADVYKETQEKTKVNGEIREVAAALIAKGKSDEERLALLADYCRKTIKDVWSDDTSTQVRDEFKPNKNSIDTIHRKIGTGRDIDFAFIALAQAAGYKARLALVADRQSFLFNPKLHSGFFLNNYDAAVQINGKWKFYDVSDKWAPPGTLAWREQAVYALIPDPIKSEWVQTPLLSADETKIQRVAELTLSAEGDLEGDVRELYWGNESIGFREAHASQSEAERQEFVREKLKTFFADFEITKVVVTISPDAKLPTGASYHLLLKNYAQRTGKRLLLRPNIFSAAADAYFSSSERSNAIYFNYPWSEGDFWIIHLPEGFQLEHAESPAAQNFLPVGRYAARLAVTPATNTLTYERSLTFGANQRLMFETERYMEIKAVFDQIHTSDEDVVTLKAEALR